MGMNKRGIIKTSVILLIILALSAIMVFSLFSSASVRETYLLGEGVKIDLKNCGEECTVKIKTPSETIIEKTNGPFYLLKLEEIGNYYVDIKSKEYLEKFEFEVINEKESKNHEANKAILEVNESNSSGHINIREQNIGKLKKEVVVYSEENLIKETSLVSSPIEEDVKIREKENIKVYWEENRTYVDFDAKDNDNDGLIDSVEWEIRDLSINQTFIILITKAQHLSLNKTFISDIYEQVSSLDNLWSETIPDGDYIRVTFEKNLTNENDITLYPRIISGSPSIEIYEKNKDEIIAKFEDMNSNR